MQAVAIERSIWIDAPRERVWHAITDPAQITAWFSPGIEWQGTGLKVGGRISVYNPETDNEMYVQMIDEVDAPRRLVTHSVPDGAEIPYLSTWVLEEENGGTRLTFTHSGYELEPEATRSTNMERNSMGFDLMLGNIKALIEGTELPNPGGF